MPACGVAELVPGLSTHSCWADCTRLAKHVSLPPPWLCPQLWPLASPEDPAVQPEAPEGSPEADRPLPLQAKVAKDVLERAVHLLPSKSLAVRLKVRAAMPSTQPAVLYAAKPSRALSPTGGSLSLPLASAG